jgi:predicted nuclease of predicted toxin-antitoxin system
MRFLIDAQLPPALARWLVSQGHEATHVVDCGLESADDTAIRDHARASGAVIVTKDEDFASWRILEPQGPCVVWIRAGNTSRRETLRWFASAFPDILAALRRGDTLVEIT